jgi:hypothetical protein
MGIIGAWVAAAPAAAAPASDTEKVVYEISYPERVSKDLAGMRAVNTKSGAVVAVDPPPVCDLTDVGGTITGYWVNGQLSRTEAQYHSAIHCPPTAVGQSMHYLWDLAHLNLNSGDIDWSPIASCSYFPGVPCTDVATSGYWTCNLTTLCAGDYWVENEAYMQLPDGWQWASPPPSYCYILEPRTIQCELATGRVNIPPTK